MDIQKKRGNKKKENQSEASQNLHLEKILVGNIVNGVKRVTKVIFNANES